MLEIIPSNKTTLTDDQVNRLYDLMIHAYAVTEKEIWGENYFRMSKEEYITLVNGGRVLVAWIDGRIVGSVYFYPISNQVYGFGLLNADFSESGKGIGRALIRESEKAARDQGAETMQLEILKARDLLVPVKEQLAKWYLAQGYSFLGTHDFLELKPDKVKKAKTMVNPSVFDVYTKDLTK